jgi:TRAP-type C4-dicarboxylate transport system permease small subunit
MMPTFDRTVRKFTNFLCYIAVAMLAVLMLLGSFDVIGRYFLNRPIKGALEASEVLLAGIVLFGLAYTSSTEGHVRVDTFIVLFPPRLQAIISGIISFLSLIIFCLIGWQGAELAWQSWQRHRSVDIFLIPIAPFQLFVSVGALAVCLELIVQIRQFIIALRKET